MDQKELQQKIALYYEKLPEEARVIFAGMSWIGTLEEIETKYSLSDEQIKTLGTETTILLLGIIGIEEYVDTIRKEIKLEASVVDKILDEVGEKILNDVMPHIDKAYNENMSSFIKESTGQKEDYKVQIYEISNKYGLPIDKMGEMQSVTEKFIRGEISSTKYENDISLITDFSSEKIKGIINDININIINKIRQNAIKEGIAPIIKSKKSIPLPPYAQNEVLPTKNKEINDSEEYKNHGIEIITENENDKMVEVKTEEPIKKDEVTEKPTEENKKDFPKNIIEEKLTSQTLSKSSVIDYSVPKINPKISPTINISGDNPSKKHDPYREII